MLSNLLALLPLFALPALSAPAYPTAAPPTYPTSSAPTPPASSLSSAAPPPPPYSPVFFTNSYNTSLCIGESNKFRWTGGSGRYDVTVEWQYPDWYNPPTVLQSNTEERIQEYTYWGTTATAAQITVADVVDSTAKDHFQKTGWLPIEHCRAYTLA